MIVYPAALLSSPPAGVSLDNPRILYENHLRDLDPTAIIGSTEVAGAPADAPTREDTFEFWQPSVLPATLEATLSTIKTLSGVGVVHTLGSTGCALTVESSIDGVTYSQFSLDAGPGDDAPLFFIDNSRSYTRLRLTVEGGVGARLPQIAVAYSGAVLALQRSVYGGVTPTPMARVTEFDQPLSRGGQFLGQNFRSLGIETSMDLRYLTASWYRANFEPFVKAARKFPYFIAWRPSDFPNEAAYMWAIKDIVPKNMGKRDFMQVGWPMHGIGWE